MFRTVGRIRRGASLTVKVKCTGSQTDSTLAPELLWVIVASYNKEGRNARCHLVLGVRVHNQCKLVARLEAGLLWNEIHTPTGNSDEYV